VINIKIEGIVLILLTSLLLAGSASALTVNANDASGAKGSMVQLAVTFEGASNVGSMDLVLTYDPAIAKAMGVDTGPLAKNAYVESNTAKPGEVTIGLADSGGITGNGEVLTVSFLLNGGVGSQSMVTVQEATVHTVELVEVAAITDNGLLQVTAGAAPTKSGSEMGMITVAVGALLAGILLFRRRGLG
jgi:hypothetical protein